MGTTYEQVYYVGKYKGRPLAEVPSDYHQWALRTLKLSSGLRAAVAAELEVRGVSAPPPPAPKPELPCHRCGLRAFRYRWMEDRRGRRQVRRECSEDLPALPMARLLLAVDKAATQLQKKLTDVRAASK